MKPSYHKVTSTLNVASLSPAKGPAKGSKSKSSKAFDGVVIVGLVPNKGKTPAVDHFLSSLPKAIAQAVSQHAARTDFKVKSGALLVLDVAPTQHVVLWLVGEDDTMFQVLTGARKVWASFKEFHATNVALDLRHLESRVEDVADALASAQFMLDAPASNYKSKKNQDKQTARTLTFITAKDLESAVRSRTQQALEVSEGTAFVRRLVTMAGNDLTPESYVKFATEEAKGAGLKTEFFPTAKLKKMGAGAFCAVAQGSGNNGGGILKIEYTPEKSGKHLAFVGKGVTFDTGGHNLKPSQWMFGMHNDMAGSAVTLALILLAKREQWPVKVTTWMAITDNLISPAAYRCNDVVTSLNGTSIEVIDTDAEGRMILSDTLTLASREKPDLVMDFATLTGACVRAIGTSYAGVFTNEASFHEALVVAGRTSGERVWPFPMDPDYAKPYDSEVADTKQCRNTPGGCDHIEAALFLQKFVEKGVKWVHVDLASVENSGGLAHVPTETTGFGVRFTRSFVAPHLS